MTATTKLAVIGAGAWGTVLAQLLAQNGQRVTLWARSEEQAVLLQESRVNSLRLPGLTLHPGITVTASLPAAGRCAAAFIVVPSVHLPALLPRLPALPAFVSCSKGFSPAGLKRLSRLIKSVQPGAEAAALSGPNLAGEIAAGRPAAAVVAGSEGFTQQVQRWLQQPAFRVYRSADLAGVELGGALKNIIALAAGMSAGLGLGENAKAAIITRGLHEMVRLGVRLGGQQQTFYGLSGLGDLVATCAGPESRNFSAGLRLARGETLADLQASGLNAEGIAAVQRVHTWALEQKTDLPISSAVHQVIFAGKEPAAALRQLMERSSRPETELY